MYYQKSPPTFGKNMHQFRFPYFVHEESCFMVTIEWTPLSLLTIGGRGITYSGRPSGRPLFVISRDSSYRISVLNVTTMKLDTYVHRLTWHCGEGFQGQRSKVKVTARANALLRSHTFRLCVTSRLSGTSIPRRPCVEIYTLHRWCTSTQQEL